MTHPALRAPLRALLRALHGLENGLIFALFGVAILLPLIEAACRPFDFHLSGTAVYVQHAVLWLSFLGGLIATRDRKHLQLSTSEMLPEGRWRDGLRIVSHGLTASITFLLAKASYAVVEANREQGDLFSIGIPEWVSELIMPVAMVLIGLRFVRQASPRWWGQLLALSIAPIGFLLDFTPGFVADYLWIISLVILVAALFGTPIFAAMAGLGMLFFFDDGTPIVAMPAEIYRLISSPTIPAIPLLTVCGYILAESDAARRLVRFFRALFGWMPGGVAVLVAGVCAVFTTFTGGSGVTIIALGGLVYGILREGGYPENFSLGLVTASGSLGLLFPPSLPVILYAVVVSSSPEFSVAADDLYIAGLLPGLLLIVMVAAYGMMVGRKVEGDRPAFNPKELLGSTWEARWELSVPALVIVLFASGWASMVEAAAAAAAYAVIVECFINRDIHPIHDLPGVLARAGVLVGAVLILLAAAFGLSYYVITEAGMPDLMLEWIQPRITEPWMFLLALNALLLLLGAVLEIYSAIVIIPPILAPIAAHYGIDPLHLGVIFLANLELGFISPPVGLNLFLAASRFDKPMFKLYRSVLPYLAIMFVGVMLITFVPSMSVGVANLFRDTEETHDSHLAQPPVQQIPTDPAAVEGPRDRAHDPPVPDRSTDRRGDSDHPRPARDRTSGAHAPSRVDLQDPRTRPGRG